MGPINLWVDVTIHQKQIDPTVVIKIREAIASG